MPEVRGNAQPVQVLRELHRLVDRPSSHQLAGPGLSSTSVLNLLKGERPRPRTVTAFIESCLAYARRHPAGSRLDREQRVLAYWRERYDQAVGPVDGRTVCPYPGLASFGPEHARWFFGRETLTAELVGRLDQRSTRSGMQMVMAPSGAGKSSLLRAGLASKLAAGALPGSAEWTVEVITPTTHPVQALEAVDTARVVIVDQLEESFTLCADVEERRAFFRSLARLSDSAYVVLGARADFYPAYAQDPVLRPVLQDRQLVVGPLSADELRAAITKPADAVGLTVEPELVEVLLSDLGGDGTYPAERLPLLAHALRTCWFDKVDRRLTVAGYRATGGIQGAIQRTADRVFESLDTDERVTAETLFIQLVRFSDEGRDTLQRRRRDDLGRVVDRVVDAYVAARLLTVHHDTIEITHEALLRAWPLLRTWINTHRANQLIAQELHDNAVRWQANPDPSWLYRGNRLEAARIWVATAPQGAVTPTITKFLTASTSTAALELDRHRTSALTWVREFRRSDPDTALAIALVAAKELPPSEELLFALWGMIAPARITRLAMAHAGDVQSIAWTPDRAEFVSVASDSSLCRWSATGDLLDVQHDLTGKGFLLSPDASLLLYLQQDGSMHIVRLADGAVLARLVESTTDKGWHHDASCAWSHQGHMLACDGNKYSTIWWFDDVPDPARPRFRSVRADGYPVWSPDDRTIAFLGSRSVSLFDVATGGLETLSIDAALDASWAPSGDLIAIVRGGWPEDEGGDELVVHDRTGEQLATRDSDSSYESVAWSPDGTTIAVTERDSEVHTLRLLDSRLEQISSMPAVGPAPLRWSHDSRYLALPGSHQGLLVVDVSTGTTTRLPTGHITDLDWAPDHAKALVTRSHGDPVELAGTHLSQWREWTGSRHRLVWAPDGRTVATQVDASIQIWSADLRVMHAEIAPGLSHWTAAMSWSPDGSKIAISDNGTILVWEPLTATFDIRRLGSRFVKGWSPDSRKLATGRWKEPISIWDSEGGASVDLEGSRSGTVAWSPDGRTIVGCDEHDKLAAWDAATLRPHPTLHFTSDCPTTSTIDWSNPHVLVTTLYRDILLHDPDTGRRIATCEVRATTSHLSWSPDRTFLASASHDDTVRLWSASGDPLALLLLPNVLTLHWSSERTLTATTHDNRCHHWDLPEDLQTVIAVAETHQPKPLTAAERHRFGLPVPDTT